MSRDYDLSGSMRCNHCGAFTALPRARRNANILTSIPSFMGLGTVKLSRTPLVSFGLTIASSAKTSGAAREQVRLSVVRIVDVAAPLYTHLFPAMSLLPIDDHVVPDLGPVDPKARHAIIISPTNRKGTLAPRTHAVGGRRGVATGVTTA